MASIEFFIWFVMIFFVLLGLVATVLIMSYMKRYRIVIRDLSGKRVLATVWAFEKVDKSDGSIWWRSFALNKYKIKIPEPPQDCLSYDNRGKPLAEVRRLGVDEYVYCKPNKFKDSDTLKEDGTTIFKSISQPFSKVQRQIIVQNFAKAERTRKKAQSFLQQHGLSLAAFFVMALVIIMIIVYWGELAQAHLEINSQSSGILKEIKGVAGELKGTSQTIGQTTNKATGGG